MKEALVHARDVSFSLQKGSFGVIPGPQGASKTALLNLLGGVDMATSERHLFDREKVCHFTFKKMELFQRNEIGFFFQFYNLMENLTAYENVAIVASIVTSLSIPRRS